mgnify:FL=1
MYEEKENKGMSQDVRPCTRLANTFPNYHRDYCERYPEKMRELFQRQSPGAMMLSCCDSRTDPALLFSCHPGDLFVHRAIAALVPPLDSPVGACIRAATNYAVESLKVRDLIVLGHTACGGISGLVKGVADTPLEDWIRVAEPVLASARELHPNATEEELARECERLAPVFSLKNLEAYPWVARGLGEGRLTIHAWLYSLREGELFEYDLAKEEYRPIP